MNDRKKMAAIIRKDLRMLSANRRLFAALLCVPVILAVLLPSIFVGTIYAVPDDPDIYKLVEMLPEAMQAESLERTALQLIMNYVFPAFFLMIPIMASSVTAASSFVGEKEKSTLETLLYCPLSVRQIFQAKVLASFLLSMAVSLGSFLLMAVVLEGELFILMGWIMLPGANWIAVLLLLSPAVSLIAVTVIVRGSAKAQSVEESQQGAVFLIMPVLLLVVGQFTGVLLLDIRIMLGIGLVCALLAWVLIRKAAEKFNCEMLLM
ncbi:ABC transporter permease [Lachnoclostridium sp. An169]|uniref:ABC transporter permease n=1 Tax=Lachnoclostridium sp. An169 TaxID=1965569 RepID=UPI001FA8815B|nr:ABC transporter permease [Lachnoclostridium sp. An169]